jgi:hypothetical protein
VSPFSTSRARASLRPHASPPPPPPPLPHRTAAVIGRWTSRNGCGRRSRCRCSPTEHGRRYRYRTAKNPARAAPMHAMGSSISPWPARATRAQHLDGAIVWEAELVHVWRARRRRRRPVNQSELVAKAGDDLSTARARNHHFWPLSALHAHTTAPYET